MRHWFLPADLAVDWVEVDAGAPSAASAAQLDEEELPPELPEPTQEMQELYRPFANMDAGMVLASFGLALPTASHEARERARVERTRRLMRWIPIKVNER